MKFVDALPIAKKYASKKFDESVDLSIVLGIDAKKSDQQIRGVLSLPKMPEKKNKDSKRNNGNLCSTIR